MQDFEIGYLGLIASLNQCLKASLYQAGNTSTEHGLFPEEVGLGLLGEGGLNDASPAAADTIGIGQGDVPGVTGGILMHGNYRRRPHLFCVELSQHVTGALGRYHDDVYI